MKVYAFILMKMRNNVCISTETYSKPLVQKHSIDGYETW